MSAALALTDPGSFEPRLPDGDFSVETATFVLSLRARGISDLPLLRAMETVPREVFAPRRYGDLARHDVALPLPCGETMTAPSTVAAMLAALCVRPGLRVLEIGTGSGYVTALLSALGASVHSLERRAVLAEGALQRLGAVGLADGCEVGCADGFDSEAADGRYDRIVLNGALAAAPPAHLTSRLVVGGSLVCGLAIAPGQTRLLVVTRRPDGELATRSGSAVRLCRFS